jgi:hypothetical protein
LIALLGAVAPKLRKLNLTLSRALTPNAANVNLGEATLAAIGKCLQLTSLSLFMGDYSSLSVLQNLTQLKTLQLLLPPHNKSSINDESFTGSKMSRIRTRRFSLLTVWPLKTLVLQNVHNISHALLLTPSTSKKKLALRNLHHLTVHGCPEVTSFEFLRDMSHLRTINFDFAVTPNQMHPNASGSAVAAATSASGGIPNRIALDAASLLPQSTPLLQLHFANCGALHANSVKAISTFANLTLLNLYRTSPASWQHVTQLTRLEQLFLGHSGVSLAIVVEFIKNNANLNTLGLECCALLPDTTNNKTVLDCIVDENRPVKRLSLAGIGSDWCNGMQQTRVGCMKCAC